MTADRAAFLAVAATPLPRESVAVPGLGAVWVRTMTAGQRDRYEVRQAKDNEAEPGLNYRARLVVFSATDEAGADLFTEADIPALSGMAPAVLDPIVTAALRLNGIGAEAMEAEEKNSPGGPG